jgi:Zn-dependent M16 (insulinase) family peptidase
MISHSLHEGDPMNLFRINEFSQQIRKDFKQGLLQDLVDKHLLQNKHYLRLYYTADEKKTEKEELKLKKQMEALG